MNDVLQGESRARNMSKLPWVGDPERWGGSQSFEIQLDPIGPTTPDFNRPTLIRAQTTGLVAVGWDLVGVWDVAGFQSADDTVRVVWRVTVGTGQATSILVWELGTLSPAGDVPNPQAAALGWSSVSGGGVALSGQPIVACNLSAQAIVFASTVGVAHTLRVTCNGHCAPRGWVP